MSTKEAENDLSDAEEEKNEEDEKVGKKASSEGSNESTAHRKKRQLMDVHEALFELQQEYTILCQLIKSSFNCYVVSDRLTTWVAKIAESHDKGIPRGVVCMTRCIGLPFVAQLHKWYKMSNDMYVTITPEYKDDGLETIYKSPKKIQSYMRQLFTALLGCFKVGVIHRDVKPGNVYYDSSNDSLVLADFDSSSTGVDRIRTYTHVGTDGFRSPQLTNGTGYDWRTDVYSAGVVFGMLLYQVRSEIDVDNKLVSTWRKSKSKTKRVKKLADAISQDLLWRLIDKNANNRPSYEACLSHPYFQQKFE
jgi:serine/threonine protein kinase